MKELSMEEDFLQNTTMPSGIEMEKEMTGFTIDLNYEMVDKIVFKQLQDSREAFAEDLASINRGASRNIFVYGNNEEDAAEIQKHIDALDLVLEWFRIPE
jgi:hypothetical protein